MSAQQPELIPFGNVEAIELPARPALESSNSLEEAIPHFVKFMDQKEYAENTVKSFLNDMKLFLEFIGPKTPLANCSQKKLEGFVHYLEHERKAPCSPKSLDRRITTLKVFFGWLARHNILAKDPAEPLVYTSPAPRLPRILSEEQVETVLSITRSMRDAPDAPDARPHLLATLLLATGIKKAECMRIALEHIDLTNTKRPTVYVHYEKPRQRSKARLLALPAEWTETLGAYIRRYQPTEKLFECTPRNLEYVLHNTSTLARLPYKLTFEMLRWTSAARSYDTGIDEDRLRKRLGLSRISWRETLPIIQKLAKGDL